MSATPVSVVPILASLRAGRIAGTLTRKCEIIPGLTLRVDPALTIDGRFRSPAGRLLEIDAQIEGVGHWVGLHMALGGHDISLDLAGATWLTLTCRTAAPTPLVVRACLRSGLENPDGFVDCFFDKHILSGPDPLNHVDTLHLPTQRQAPDHAPWHELVLFLPRMSFQWHLHDLTLVIT